MRARRTKGHASSRSLDRMYMYMYSIATQSAELVVTTEPVTASASPGSFASSVYSTTFVHPSTFLSNMGFDEAGAIFDAKQEGQNLFWSPFFF